VLASIEVEREGKQYARLRPCLCAKWGLAFRTNVRAASNSLVDTMQLQINAAKRCRWTKVRCSVGCSRACDL